MKKLFLIIPLVILLCLAFACDKEDEGLTDVQIGEMEDALKKNYEQYFTAMMGMDVDGMLAYYSDTDFHEILMGINIYRDKEAFKELIMGMIEGRESHGHDNLVLNVTILSLDAAYVSASYDYTINYKDGRIYEGKSVHTSIWKMETEGWKMTHDHVSWAGGYVEEEGT
jgi:ketosteroid isomerase-like protein